MQGDDRVIEALNEVLTAELTAINQYFIHAKMSANWGYERRAEHLRNESIDEMKHAEQLIERILYFEGTPNMQRLFPVQVGESVEEQLRARPGVSSTRPSPASTTASRCASRSVTTGPASCWRSILVSEEEHVDWLETQLETIRQIGIENYLAQQLH